MCISTIQRAFLVAILSAVSLGSKSASSPLLIRSFRKFVIFSKNMKDTVLKLHMLVKKIKIHKMFRSYDFDKSYIFHTLAELKYLRTLSKFEHSFAHFTLLWPSNTFSLLFLCSPKNFGGAYSRRLVRPSVSPSVRPSVRTSHSCPAHNFVIWSGISKLFYRNHHHVETTCRAQHLGRYLEGQGHSATL